MQKNNGLDSRSNAFTLTRSGPWDDPGASRVTTRGWGRRLNNIGGHDMSKMLYRGSIRENNLGDFWFFPNLLLYFRGLLSLYHSKLAN